MEESVISCAGHDYTKVKLTSGANILKSERSKTCTLFWNLALIEIESIVKLITFKTHDLNIEIWRSRPNFMFNRMFHLHDVHNFESFSW